MKVVQENLRRYSAASRCCRSWTSARVTGAAGTARRLAGVLRRWRRKIQRAELLAVGRNCWRIEHASRAGFLIDADAYFRRSSRLPPRAPLDPDRRLGLPQPHAPVVRERQGLRAGARPVPQRPGAPPARAARQHPDLGLPDDLRARPRVGAAVWPVVEAAPPDLLPLRQHASRRRLASSRRSWSSTTRSPSAAAST